MNIREELQRHLIETNQVMQTRRYNWLWATALALSLVSVFHVFEPEFWQMRRLRSHIEDISPQWDAFKRANPPFQPVELYPSYDEAYGVRFAAKGALRWRADLNQLAEFMSSTKPPYPVDISKVTTSRPTTKERLIVLARDGKHVEMDVLVDPDPITNLDTTQSRTASGRWELAGFQLPSTNLAGLRLMRPFRARVETVGRTMPYNTGVSSLEIGLRLESGELLEVAEPGATEQMFALARSLMDTRLHEFPSSWFGSK